MYEHTFTTTTVCSECRTEMNSLSSVTADLADCMDNDTLCVWCTNLLLTIMTGYDIERVPKYRLQNGSVRNCC